MANGGEDAYTDMARLGCIYIFIDNGVEDTYKDNGG